MPVSKIVCNKLPQYFLIDLFSETSTNYPSFRQLLKVYQTILTRLKVNSKQNSKELKNDVQVIKSSSKDGVKSKMFSKSSNPSSGKDVSETKSVAVKGTSAKCRFCSSFDHTTINCDVYPSVEARVKLADQKGWCRPTRCLSGKHKMDSCPGKSVSLHFKCYQCKKSERHAAVCPSSENFASKSSKGYFSYQSNPGVMDPVLSFTISRGKSKAKFVFLLDSGAQFNSICKEAMEKYVDGCRSPPMARFVYSYGQSMGR